MLPTETDVWVECDGCGVAFGGPGLSRVVSRVGKTVLCTGCQRKLTSGNGIPPGGVCREAVTAGTTGELGLGGA